jgi:protein required for attachment to host cells
VDTFSLFRSRVCGYECRGIGPMLRRLRHERNIRLVNKGSYESDPDLVLIADAARARAFETRGKRSGLTLVDDMILNAELAPSRALGTDRPGRTFESVGRARHAMENPTDLLREQKRQFARRVARAIAERHAANRFDRLVLVAPPVTMGDSRAALPAAIRSIVAAEVLADLTRTPVRELPGRLAPHINV